MSEPRSHRLLRALMWPLRPLIALLRPSDYTTATLRRVLYATSILGVLGALFAGMWTAVQVAPLLPILSSRPPLDDDGRLLVVTLIVPTVPFVLMAVLQGSSARRVLGKVPDRTLVDVPGLAAMNATARVLFMLLALGVVVLSVNAIALGLLVVGGMVAFVITIFFAIFYFILVIFTLGMVIGRIPFFETIERLWDRLTFARHFFDAQAALVDWLHLDPNWLALAAIVLGYVVPTILAVTVWRFRDRFAAIPVLPAGAYAAGPYPAPPPHPPGSPPT